MYSASVIRLSALVLAKRLRWSCEARKKNVHLPSKACQLECSLQAFWRAFVPFLTQESLRHLTLVSMVAQDVRPVTGIRDPSYGVDIPLPPAPKLLPAAIQQNPMHQVLPRQGLADAIRIGKPQRATDTEGMYPKTGYARGQKPGLATVPEHPVSGPLMPIASNFFPYGPSPLGQP